MRGTITLVFDDGYQQVFKQVLPLLNKYSIPGVFAVAIDHKEIEKSENRPVTPWQDWLKIKNDGHEIASHSVTHPNLTTLDDESLLCELTESQKKLNATTLVYPGGAYNDHVVSKAQKIFTAARTVQSGFEILPPIDSMRLPTYNFTKHNFSAVRANVLAIWAMITNSWLIETYHLVDDNEQEKVHNVSLKEFENHLKFLKKSPAKVKTIQQIINT